MVEGLRSVDISGNTELQRLAEEVQRSHQPRVLQRDGEDIAMIVPAARTRKRRPRRRETGADMAAFRASFGSWKDIDTDKLIEDIYESRRISTRPPVEL